MLTPDIGSTPFSLAPSMPAQVRTLIITLKLIASLLTFRKGNKPPWTLPAKAAYGTHDGRRAVERFPNLEIQFPEDIMAVSLTVVPLRALHFIKRNHSTTAFETALHYFFHSFWSPPNVNLTRPENVAKALSEIPIEFKGSSGRASSDGKKLFSAEEVKAIMAGASSQDMKDVLKQTTQTALDRGAFGAPWLWVTNSAGEAEPFFGSDRFHFIYKFLALPFTDVTLLPPAGEKSRL